MQSTVEGIDTENSLSPSPIQSPAEIDSSPGSSQFRTRVLQAWFVADKQPRTPPHRQKH